MKLSDKKKKRITKQVKNALKLALKDKGLITGLIYDYEESLMGSWDEDDEIEFELEVRKAIATQTKVLLKALKN